MPDEIGLTAQEIAAIHRASRWVVLTDMKPDMLRSFVVGSLSDLALSKKVSTLSVLRS